MKGVLTTAFLMISSVGININANADDGHRLLTRRDCAGACHCHREYTTFRILRPADVFHGIGCYCKEVTDKAVDGVGTVLRGTGEIITSPFKSHMRFPEMRQYRWYRGHWHQVRPLPRGVRPQDLKPPKIFVPEPDSNLGDPAPAPPAPCVDRDETEQFIPFPYVEPEVKGTIALLRVKF